MFTCGDYGPRLMIKPCPHCQRKFSYDRFNTDFQHECNSGKDVLDQEDVSKIGNWTDANGDTGVVNKSITQVAGTANKIQGSDAFHEEGAKQGNLTIRGNNADTHRQRKYFRHIDLTSEK